MGHLGIVLYEYLGEEYPEVLGSILGALKVTFVLISYCKIINWCANEYKCEDFGISSDLSDMFITKNCYILFTFIVYCKCYWNEQNDATYQGPSSKINTYP